MANYGVSDSDASSSLGATRKAVTLLDLKSRKASG